MKQLSIYIIIICLFSCEKPFDFDYSNFIPKQVLISTIRSGRNISVYITKSKTANDNTSLEYIKDAEVLLYENGIFKEQLVYTIENTASGSGYYYATTVATVGKSYTLISKHSTLPTIETTEYLPDKPTINSIAITKYPDSTSNNTLANIAVVLNDSSINNYYSIDVNYRISYFIVNSTNNDTSFYQDYFDAEFNINEFPRKKSTRKVYFTDVTFNGNIKTLQIEFEGIPVSKNILELYYDVDIASMGKGYYNYFLTESNLGQFSSLDRQPNNIISNITNGYGFFGAVASKRYNFILK